MYPNMNRLNNETHFNINCFIKNLTVPYRINYKLSLTIYKSIHHNFPDYLASLLHLNTPITPLQTRSSNTFILITPNLHTLHYSNIRSFALSDPYH